MARAKIELNQLARDALEYFSRLQHQWIRSTTPEEVEAEFIPGRIYVIRHWTYAELMDFLDAWRDQLNEHGIPKDPKMQLAYNVDLVRRSVRALRVNGKEESVMLSEKQILEGHGMEMANLVNTCFLFNCTMLGVGPPLPARRKSAPPTTSPRAPSTRQSPTFNAPTTP